jgi:hypothetical protein
MATFDEMTQIVYFIIIFIGGIVSVYAKMKAEGKVPFAVAKIEAGKAKIADGLQKIDVLTSECAIAQDVKAVVGNISSTELNVILTVAADRASQTGGYTLKDAEEIGEMIIKAAKTGGNT